MSAEETVRINRFLAERGVCSRREADEMIVAERVTIDGALATVADRVDPARQVVRVDGKELPDAPPKVYYLLYKPKGTITSRDDPRGRKSVLDLVEHLQVRVEPVGRLDFDTEGALLLTNDGEVAHRLTHPSSKTPKRYLAKVYRTPDEVDLEKIRKGKVFLEDGAALPALVRVVEQTDNGNAWVEITVTEGRNRLVRRIFEALGHPVAKLRRETFATLSIRGMERGDVRPLTTEEVRRIRDLAEGRKPTNAGKLRRKAGFAVAKPKKKRHGKHRTRKNRG
ncbi:MAG: rRNA pseudouridine synthase [Myxococcales bacterium]|nr:rRNA pseudouridine synthase [Myxococcales bacterium]MCA9570465.1 rRNA pseudouridine synthase [Myxococcales bacterium]MCB9667917.1 rRNA pseudouridine synthase [Alphaproteobacteria bacterium]